VFGVLLTLASVGVLVGGGVLMDRYSSSVHQTPLIDPGARADRVGVLRPGKPANILLIGTDLRPDENPNDQVRSDSIIIVHIPPTHDRAYLISIPRDLVVDIPANPRTGQGPAHEKINAAFAYGNADGGGRTGGMRLLSQTVTGLTGIRFDAGAIINFTGFQSVVAALGGVDMCVDQRVVSIHTGAVYQPGCRHLRPWQALDYVRQRENLPEGDYDRERHQQQFLKAVLKQATGTGVITDPARLDGVLRAAGDALTFDGGGASPVEWAFALRGTGPNSVVMLRTVGHGVFAKPGDFSSYQGEELDPAGVSLFRAVRHETLDQWAAENPELVSNDK
jgi:LCP family protein required for cell wall assembly